MKRGNFSVLDLTYMALIAAMVAVLGFISIPLPPVPITGQTLGIMLAGAVLGARRGALSLVLFILLVAVGMPILSGGRGGIGALFGPSGGYIFSWPFAAYFIGKFTERHGTLNFIKSFIPCVLFGIILVYAVGVPWLKFMTHISWDKALVGGALPFIPGDLIKAVLASLVAVAVRKARPALAYQYNHR
jgi:biotin transport system substrate-specific component